MNNTFFNLVILRSIARKNPAFNPVILSLRRILGSKTQILRFTQDDRLKEKIRRFAQDDRLGR